MKRKNIVATALVAVLLAAVLYLYGHLYSGGQTPSGQPPLRSVTAQNVADIKNQFNAAMGDVRVVLLLSPT